MAFAAVLFALTIEQGPVPESAKLPNAAPETVAAASAPAAAPAEYHPTIFAHPDNSRYWLSGQMNFVAQGHPAFHSPYQGEMSLDPAAEVRLSRLLTLYTGVRLTDRASLLFDLEMSGGHGIGNGVGLAGFTNLDVVRTPNLGSAPYVGRLMFHQVWPLSSSQVEADRGPLSLAPKLPARRLEFRAGKFSLADFLDVNPVGSDSHLQFLNWAVCNNAAYDYAADTRGYTVAAMAEYHHGAWAVRFAEALMPTVANGTKYQWDLRRAHAENLEVERRVTVGGRDLTLRVLGFGNHANMGSYREAIDQYVTGQTPRPDITNHPLQTRSKFGAALNVDAALTAALRVYGRTGWNDGKSESFVYTEADRTVSGGFDLAGEAWGRPHDKLGAVMAIEGLSPDHREYLALGGLGFLLGDGRLTYGKERVFEFYYTIQLWHGLFVSADLQHVTNPGYNQDRGPVLVPAVRLHVEF